MSTIRITVDSKEAREAFRRSPEVLRRHLSAGLDQGGEVVAREARRIVAQRDVTANLKNSIRVEAPAGEGELVREVVAASEHARFVEEGTGRFAGRAAYFPNPDRLLEYLKAHRGPRGFAFGGGDRGAQELGLWFRARAWAQAIFARGGTRAHPFMAPAAERSEARVRTLMDEAVTRGLGEVFGGGA